MPLSGLSFHHVGVACRDLESEAAAFAALGYVAERPDFYDPIQGVHGRFLVGNGPRLEFLRNHAEVGVLTPWLRKGVRFYHLAYEAQDFDAAGTGLVAAGGKQVGSPQPAVAFDGRLICFYMLQNLSLIELISAT